MYRLWAILLAHTIGEMIPKFPQGPYGVGSGVDQHAALVPPFSQAPISISTAVPLIESGTGAAGTSANPSAGDHVHPAATAVAPGAVGDITAEAIASTASAGASGKYADASHRHAMPAAGAPAAEALNSTQVTGAAGTFADSAHVHAMPGKSVAVPLVESGAGSAGTSAVPSLEDHVHPAAGFAFAGCSVAYSVAGLSIPNNAFTKLTFDTETSPFYDVGNVHAGTDFTATSAGTWSMTCSGEIQPAAAGLCILAVFINGVEVSAPITRRRVSNNAAFSTLLTLSIDLILALNDVVTFQVIQTSGGAVLFGNESQALATFKRIA